jgi:hypothetical protein
VNGADGKGLFEAEFGKFRSAYIGPTSVHFVDGHENGFAAPAEAGGGFTVERDDPLLNIDDKDYDIGGLDRQFDLLERGTGDDVVSFFTAKEPNPAGIHESEAVAMPFGLGGNAIASDARPIVDDGDATAGDAVEKRGFSDVWATDNGDESWHGPKMLQKERLRKEKSVHISREKKEP